MKQNILKKFSILDIMVLPALILVIIFCYLPMFGIIIAFQDFNPAMGFIRSKFVGLYYFRYMFSLPNFYLIVRNTIFISFMKTVTGLVIPIVVTLLLNEIKLTWLKRSIQTSIYLPYFLSWVIVGGMMIDLLSPSNGIVNQFLSLFGVEPIYFLGNTKLFPYVMVVSNVWKEFGFSTVLYLAALTGISPSLYEASYVDGANRWKQTLHITLPGLRPTIVILATLSLANILNAGFEQVFNLYSPQVYETGDIIDTFVYRSGFLDAQFSFATAVGLFKSIISCIFISTAYYISYKYADYKIF